MPGSDAINLSNDLPEYVAECDEHLTAARRTLLALEADPSRVERGQLDALFRAFHSVKGLSGMVGVREAELLAHHLETYLVTVRTGLISLTADGVRALIDGVQAIESIIAARRDGQPAPPIDVLAGRFMDLVPRPRESQSLISNGNETESDVAPAQGPLPADKQARLDAALRQGAHIWRVRFTPSAERAAAGVTVSTVRDRLLAVGEIIHAEPAVLPGGGIAFTFLVASPGPESAAELTAEGVVIEPYHAVPVLRTETTTGPTGSSLTPTNLVRVDLGRLDDLMRTVGDLVVTRARLENGLGRVGSALPAGDRRELEETSLALERQLRDLRDGVMRVRLVPVRDVFERMRLVVRDLARETGKDVELHLTGEQTEVDKFVVERLADPLLHLVRNAVSHGLESPDERVTVGKPVRGRLELRAAAAGGAMRIEVEDDGRGIDTDRVFARARAAGLVAPDAPADPATVLDLICTPGFSTRETADRASGRGVGMDVVRRAVEELGGSLALTTRRGAGARFTLRLPLTLAIADALILRVGDQTYAVAQSAVREVVQIEPGTTVHLENNELVRRPGGVLPLFWLTDLFGGSRPAGPFPALVAGDGGNSVALAADRVLGLREVVVRPLADPLLQVPGLAGATELGDGRPILILDPVGLARSARVRRRATA